jgi:hypothetical protein
MQSHNNSREGGGGGGSRVTCSSYGQLISLNGNAREHLWSRGHISLAICTYDIVSDLWKNNPILLGIPDAFLADQHRRQ